MKSAIRYTLIIFPEQLPLTAAEEIFIRRHELSMATCRSGFAWLTSAPIRRPLAPQSLDAPYTACTRDGWQPAVVGSIARIEVNGSALVLAGVANVDSALQPDKTQRLVSRCDSA